jgi:hypothetical protein
MRPDVRALAIALVPGGLLVLALGLVLRAWRRRQATRDAAQVDALIAAKGARPRFTGHDDRLRVKTHQRREAADRFRRKAAHVESGAPVSDVLRLVK